MLNFRLSLYRSQKEDLEKRIAAARKLGNIPLLNKALAILAIAEGICPIQVANTLKLSAESIRLWLCSFLLFGVSSLNANKSPGRPPKLTKTQALITVSASRRIVKVGWLQIVATFNSQIQIVNTEIVPVPLSVLPIKWPKR